MYDLHSHSNFSDGILRPQDLVSRAKEQGVTTLALTDHDTTAGLGPAQREAVEQGIELICGIELSCLWRGIGIHILGLKIDPQHPTMQMAVQQQLQSRQQRARQISEKLERCGFINTYEGAAQFAGEGVIGRPHFARHLVAAGHVKNDAEAFKRYLGAGKVGDVKQLWPDIDTAIGWIRDSGGVAVLAHPDKYNMTRTKLRSLLELFVEAGGQAIEVVSGKQLPQVSRDMANLAERYNLWSSCGSDFHVPNQHWQELGGFPQLPQQCDPVWCHW